MEGEGGDEERGEVEYFEGIPEIPGRGWGGGGDVPPGRDGDGGDGWDGTSGFTGETGDCCGVCILASRSFGFRVEVVGGYWDCSRTTMDPVDSLELFYELDGVWTGHCG